MPDQTPDTQSERWFDEAELALMHLAETFKPKAEPFVSEYLTRPLRTEAEVRAARIPQAKGLAQCIAECTGIDKAFRALIGGGQ